MPADHFGADPDPGDQGEEIARVAPGLVETVVDVLADLAGPGPALELAIGSGVIAVPLRQRGIEVFGIDPSPTAAGQLKAKAGAVDIDVVIGDIASTEVNRTFSLAYALGDAIMSLTSQDAQVACFENVARHLEPGGLFVLEVAVPDLQRLPVGESVRPSALSETEVAFDEYDLVYQTMVSHRYRMEGEYLRAHAVPLRYVWPAELDLMARLAGMVLRERWNSWARAPFTSSSRQHISIWERSGERPPPREPARQAMPTFRVPTLRTTRLRRRRSGENKDSGPSWDRLW